MEMRDYLKKTESAARKLFEGMESYKSLLREGMLVCPAGAYANDDEARKASRQWTEANKDRVMHALTKQRKYMEEHFALAVLCGALLQIAEKGIEMHSSNKTVPEEWKEFVPAGSMTCCYCCGRRVRNIPIGLVIHAGRNQYAHFEEEPRKPVCRVVFSRLAENPNDKNLALDMTLALMQNEVTGTHTILSDQLMKEFGWDFYEAYEKDMLELAGP